MPCRTTSLIVTPRVAAMTLSCWRSAFVISTEMRTVPVGTSRSSVGCFERLRGGVWAMRGAKMRVDAYTHRV